MQEPKPDFCVLDPGMGNLRSVCRAWEASGARVRLAARACEVGTPQALVFPGQGGMKLLMQELRQRGLEAVIRDWIAADRPFFGICLGLQALFGPSEESGESGLGVFAGAVPRFQLPSEYKIPHMGWNAVRFVQRTPVDKGLSDGDQLYFVHSYRVEPEDASLIWAETEYGGDRFCAAIRRGNCYATQFHPEKSQAKGLQIYRNFVGIIKNSTKSI